jgi:predicted phage-related endonuclease
VIVPRAAPREQWLAERRRHMCASDWAKVLGLAPRSWGGEYSVWANKTGLVEDDAFSYRLRVGTIMEDAVINLWLATQTEVEWVKPPRRSGLIESRTRPLFAATPDRVGECTRGRCSDEAKTTGDRKQWGTDLDPRVPVYYHFQGQAQILSDNLHHVHYVAMDDNWRIIHRTVDRDDELIERVCDRLEAWWDKHVIGGEIPVPHEGDHDTLVQQFTNPVPGKAVPLTDELQDLVLRLHRIKARAGKWKTEAAAIQARLCLFLGEAEATEALWPDGATAFTWNVSERTIDGADKDWRDQNRALAREYLDPVPAWKVNVARLQRDYPTMLPARLRWRRTFDLKGPAS